MKYESHHFPRPNPLPDHRWSPLRCGFLNIYKYDEEVFVFERGRLLHRGNNGSGKSRSLALQLPFLFDGDISPHRVEPDGDPSKRSYSILRHVEPDEQKQTVGWFSMKGINHDRTIVAIECLLTTTEPERAESSRTEIECRDRCSISLE